MSSVRECCTFHVNANSDVIFVWLWCIDTINNNEWLIDITTNGSEISYKIDSGAQVNVLPKAIYNKLQQKSRLHPTDVKLSAYNGSGIPVLGRAILNLTHKNKNISVLFIIVDINATPVLGLQTSAKLNLIQRVYQVSCNPPPYLDQFKDCFCELGKLPGLHHITVDPRFLLLSILLENSLSV